MKNWLSAWKQTWVDFFAHLKASQARYILRSWVRLLRQRRVTVGHTKLHPVWWDDPEWAKYTQVYVFMLEDFWKQTFSGENHRYAEDYTDFRVARRALLHVFKRTFDHLEGVEWGFTDVKEEPQPYFVVGIVDDMLMVQIKLTETDLPVWTAYTVKKLDKLK